jgi:heme exporter protein D
MTEFFAMGGHAVFVWGAWGLTALGVAGLVWMTLARRKIARDLLNRLQRMDAETSRARETAAEDLP